MIEKKECEGTRPSVTSDINDDAVVQIASDRPRVEEDAYHAQLELMLSMIPGSYTINDAKRNQAAGRIESIKNSLKEEPLLDNMDILIIRCYYFQGMSQNDVAKLVKEPLQRVVRKREAAIKRIRLFMEAHGLTQDAFGL